MLLANCLAAVALVLSRHEKRRELWGGYHPKCRLDFKAGPSDFCFLPQNLTRRHGCLVPLTHGMKPVLQLSAPRTHLQDLARTIRWVPNRTDIILSKQGEGERVSSFNC